MYLMYIWIYLIINVKLFAKKIDGKIISSFVKLKTNNYNLEISKVKFNRAKKMITLYPAI